MIGRGRNPIDLTGKRFGRIVALQDVGGGKNGRRWLVACDCGNHTVVRSGDLRSGNTASCGCGQREAAANACVMRSTHGLTGHRIATIHRNMIARCVDPSAVSFPYYGARGISVCTAWYDLRAFADWAQANGYADHLTIDRIDNDGNYCPENCQWSTYQEQARNRTNSTAVTLGGRTQTVAEWSEELGIGTTTILYRLKAGWNEATALTREVNRGMKYLG